LKAFPGLPISAFVRTRTTVFYVIFFTLLDLYCLLFVYCTCHYTSCFYASLYFVILYLTVTLLMFLHVTLPFLHVLYRIKRWLKMRFAVRPSRERLSTRSSTTPSTISFISVDCYFLFDMCLTCVILIVVSTSKQETVFPCKRSTGKTAMSEEDT
jgi:hypothetical protein